MAAHDANDKNSPPNKPSEELDLFDQLQNEFDELISDAESHATDKNDTAEPVDKLDGEIFAAIKNNRDNSEPAPPTADMFEDSADGKLPDDAFQDDFFQSDPLSDETDEPLSEDKAPIHPDMMDNNTAQRRSSGRFIMLSGLLVLIVTGGIYWFISNNHKQTEQLADAEQSVQKASSQQAETPPPAPEQVVESPQNTAQAPTASLQNNTLGPSSDQTAPATPVETVKASIQRKAIEKARTEQLANTAAAADKAKTEKHQAVSNINASTQIAPVKTNSAHHATQQTDKFATPKNSVTEKLAVIQPSTPLQQTRNKPRKTAAAADASTNWVIELASVNSDKSARQHVARMQDMGVAGKVVQVNDHGRIFHHILITGFASKMEATRRRDALAKQLGVRGAKVYKF